MLLYAVFGIIILICAIGLIRIIGPKLRQLALIDTENIPEERAARKKKEIMVGRTHRILLDAARKAGGAVSPVAEKMRESFRARYRKLLTLDTQFRREKPIAPAEARERIAGALKDAAALLESGKTEEAEKKYIEALRYDPRHVEVYKGLAALYLEEKRFERAKETLQFLIKSLIRENRCIHGAGRRALDSATEENPGACPATPAAHADIAGWCIDLALSLSELHDDKGARGAYELAVNMEPTNPRNLDLLLEACILGGDKRRAEEVFEALRTVNAGNMKLQEFGERIAGMAEVVPKKRGKTRE